MFCQIFLLFILSIQFGRAQPRRVDDPTANIMSVTGFCEQGHWPRPHNLVYQKNPISLLSLEAESRGNRLEVLVGATLHEDGHSGNKTLASGSSSRTPSQILSSLEPALKCDFRNGRAADNARIKPMLRSSAMIIVLAEDSPSGHISAKIQCDMPTRSIEYSSSSLHWQLFLDSSALLEGEGDMIEEDGRDSWLVSPSIPLCMSKRRSDVAAIQPQQNDPQVKLRGGIRPSKEGSSSVRTALCLAPTTFGFESLGSEDNDDIFQSPQDWLYYQQRVAGFSSIFYLDPLGEEMKWLESASKDSSSFVHAPHTATHQKLARMLTTDRSQASVSVGHSLVRERCEMLARLNQIDYVLQVNDPRDILVPTTPLKRPSNDGFLPSLLEDATTSLGSRESCLNEIRLERMDVSPIVIKAQHPQETSFRHCQHQMTDNPCKSIHSQKMALVDSSRAQLEHCQQTSVADLPVSDPRAQELIKWVKETSSVAGLPNEKDHVTTDVELQPRNLRANRAIATPTPRLRMCPPTRDDFGPVYGEATLLPLHKDGCDEKRATNGEPMFQDIDEIRLTFYSVETIVETNSMKISVYAQDNESLWQTLYHESHGNKMYQSEAVFSLMPNVECIFSTSQGDHSDRRSSSTPAHWRKFEEHRNLLWLECPMPSTPAMLAKSSSFFSRLDIQVKPSKGASSPDATEFKVHTMRPISLCSVEDANDETSSAPSPVIRSKNTRIDDSEMDDAIGQHQSLSICARPFFLESECVECDGISPLTAERLIEWIEYHLLVGFDTIYIMDRYGFALLPLLQDYVQARKVVHVPFPRLTDAVLSTEARSTHSKINSAGHDQMIAYDHCLSLGRTNDDAFMAFIDVDEFIRYKESRPGQIRSVVDDLISSDWNGAPKSAALPDSIYLDRYDISVERTGMALSYTKRTGDKRSYVRNGKHLRFGKVLVRPKAFVYGCVRVHSALANGSASFLDEHPYGTNVLFASDKDDKLSIFHYREEDKRSWVAESVRSTYDENELVQDDSMKWAHDIIVSRTTSTTAWKALQRLSEQGLIRTSRPDQPQLEPNSQRPETVTAMEERRRRLVVEATKDLILDEHSRWQSTIYPIVVGLFIYRCRVPLQILFASLFPALV